MTPPDAGGVDVIGYAIAGGDGRLTPNPHAWPTREPLDEAVKSWGGMSGGPFRVVAMYGADTVTALLARAEKAEREREEAREALKYIASHRGLTLLGDGSYSDGVHDGWIQLADAADAALAQRGGG